MYRHCIYCSADLGSNEVIEAFPVGRSLAFDAAKGRLWALCGACARWNLAPLEERWEAVEAAEKTFADARLRVQSENIGVAKLADGTRLVRVGAAREGELAAWRYGDELVRRRRGYVSWSLAGAAMLGAGFVGPFVPGAGLPGLASLLLVTPGAAIFLTMLARVPMDVVAHRFREGEHPDGGAAFTLLAANFQRASLEPDDTRAGFAVRVRHRHLLRAAGPDGRRRWRWITRTTLRGDHAPRALGRGFVLLNASGGSRRAVDAATARLAHAGSAGAFLRHAAEARLAVRGPAGAGPREMASHSLALEMALHEETERRALAGELALLESAWREAEAIAAIADRLAVAPTGPAAGASTSVETASAGAKPVDAMSIDAVPGKA
jgi:hypothetical protein